MSSVGPWYGGGRRRGEAGYWDPSVSMVGGATPFYSDVLWDPRNRRRDLLQDDDTAALARARVDWRETDTAHVFSVDLPGVRREELNVQVEDGNLLRISGEHVKEEEDVNYRWHRIERHRGSFERSFWLPENVNLDGIKCSLDFGVLTVEVPKTSTAVEEAPRNVVRYIDIA